MTPVDRHNLAGVVLIVDVVATMFLVVNVSVWFAAPGLVGVLAYYVYDQHQRCPSCDWTVAESKLFGRPTLFAPAACRHCGYQINRPFKPWRRDQP